eukprot:1442402-Amphidinium_carterae.1
MSMLMSTIHRFICNRFVMRHVQRCKMFVRDAVLDVRLLDWIKCQHLLSEFYAILLAIGAIVPSFGKSQLKSRINQACNKSQVFNKDTATNVIASGPAVVHVDVNACDLECAVFPQ